MKWPSSSLDTKEDSQLPSVAVTLVMYAIGVFYTGPHLIYQFPLFPSFSFLSCTLRHYQTTRISPPSLDITQGLHICASAVAAPLSGAPLLPGLRKDLPAQFTYSFLTSVLEPSQSLLPSHSPYPRDVVGPSVGQVLANFFCKGPDRK